MGMENLLGKLVLDQSTSLDCASAFPVPELPLLAVASIGLRLELIGIAGGYCLDYSQQGIGTESLSRHVSVFVCACSGLHGCMWKGSSSQIHQW
jgi:hypothetical protein